MLAPGHLMYAHPDGDWRCALPGDRFLRLTGADDVLRAARPGLHGHPERPVDSTHFRAGLAARGLLAAPNATPNATPPQLSRATVGIHAERDHPVAALLTQLLAPHVRITETQSADVVISCAGWLPDRRWLDLDERLAAAGTAWHRCHLDATTLRLGPLTVAGRTAGYRDVRARRLAASAAPDELRALWTYLDSGMELPAPTWPGPHTIAIGAGQLIADVLAFLAGDPVESCEIAVDGATVTRHPVLPLPGAGRPVPTGLVDPRFGIVTRLREQPRPDGFPRSYRCVDAEVADTRAFAPWAADREAGGATIGDPAQAGAAAVGEAVERYCGNAVPDDLRVDTATRLVADGHDVPAPADYALYSAAQHVAPGFPFVPFTPELRLPWATGRDLVTGAEVLVPATLTYLNLRRGPALTVQAFAGIAAGPTPDAAIRSALQEIVERDAVTLWWQSGTEATALDVTGDPLLDPRSPTSTPSG